MLVCAAGGSVTAVKVLTHRNFVTKSLFQPLTGDLATIFQYFLIVGWKF